MVFVKAVPNNVQVLLMLVTTKYLQPSRVLDSYQTYTKASNS